MLIDGTSDKIQFVLGGAVTTTQLPFTVDYNNYTTSAVTLNTVNGTSNNTTAVDLVTSPSASQQNELRYCSIYNSDTASATVKIQIYDGSSTRIVFQCILAVGDTLQYQLEKGWEVVNSLGNKETFALQITGQYGAVKTLASWKCGNGNLVLSSTTWYGWYMGRAEKSYSTINFVYNITTAAAVGGAITYAEIAVYSGTFTHCDSNGGNLGRRVGVTNINSSSGGVTGATGIGVAGIKNTAITVTGINPGERLYFVMAAQWTGTAPAIAGMNYADGTGSNHSCLSTIAYSGSRPSLSASGVNTAQGIQFNSGTNGAWVSWRGT